GTLAVGKRCSEAGVEFRRFCGSHNCFEIVSIDSATGKNHDAICGGGDEIGQDGCASCSIGFSARSENARWTGCEQSFERGVEVGSFVKGPVKSYGKRTRELN